MGDSGPQDGSVALEVCLVRELKRVKDAGNALAEAAHRVSATYDGVHRLRLALAGWYQALADEFDRNLDSLCCPSASRPRDSAEEVLPP